MRHFENHVEDAQTSLNRAMDLAGFETPVALAHAFLGRRHSEPHGLAISGPDAATVDRAALWVKAWGAKHGLITRDGGPVLTVEAMKSEHLFKVPARPHQVVAFVVFAVCPFD